MLTDAQWLELGIDWKRIHHLGGLGRLVIVPGRVSFSAVKHWDDYSVYYSCWGSYGEIQFNGEAEIKRYLERQLGAKQEYVTLVARAEAIQKRIEPLERKVSIIRDTLASLESEVVGMVLAK